MPAAAARIVFSRTTRHQFAACLLRCRASRLQRTRANPACRGESPAAQRLAAVFTLDARQIRRDSACETLGRHTLRARRLAAQSWCWKGYEITRVVVS